MSSSDAPRLRRRWLIVPPVIIGLALVAWAATRGRRAERVPETERARAVTVIRAPAVDVVPRVRGHGTSEPARVWRAVAEVRGRVTEIHDELQAGALLGQGAVAFRVDATDYELAVAELRADVHRLEAQRAELEQSVSNLASSLEIEEASLAIAQREAERLRALAETGAVTDTEVDGAARAALAQRGQVQTIASQSALAPSQAAALEASLAATRARLDQAERDVGRTVVRVPFPCRVSDVSLQVGQFVVVGELLFEAHGTERTEVEAQISLDRFRPLVRRSIGDARQGPLDMKALQAALDVRAIVRARAGEFVAQWDARFLRIRERLDERTRTGGFVVAVDDPYGKAVPGERPPLMAGAYCEVEFLGAALPGRVIVPREAVWQGVVLIADAENRLRARPVEVDFLQGSFACLLGGLEPGERVLTRPPSPAIDGMLLVPTDDMELADALAAEATLGGGGERR